MGWIGAVRCRPAPADDAAGMSARHLRHPTAGWIATAFAVAAFLLAFAGFFLWMTLPSNADTVVRASWYERGRVTASGEAFHPDGLTCALPSFRAGHKPYNVRVTHLKTGRSIICRVNDRGPAAWTNNGIDLSRGAFRALGLSLKAGVAHVRIEAIK
jgi:rare lipoprotein A